MLQVKNIDTFYGDVQALYNISLEVQEGEVVTLVGANGAGKSTTLMSITGLVKVRKGEIVYKNDSLTELKPERITQKGIVLVPEGRRIFPGLTVEENLELGTCAWRKKQSQKFRSELEEMYELFPRLRERKKQLGWSLSGGEQQMLALARGLMSRPEILLLDEPSLGLAPALIETVFEIIHKLKKQGKTILLVEQNAFMALEVADRAYVIQTGEIVLQGTAEEVSNNPEIQKAYLGGN